MGFVVTSAWMCVERQHLEFLERKKVTSWTAKPREKDLCALNASISSCSRKTSLSVNFKKLVKIFKTKSAPHMHLCFCLLATMDLTAAAKMKGCSVLL